jgi:hypothetical protein
MDGLGVSHVTEELSNFNVGEPGRVDPLILDVAGVSLDNGL